MMRIPRPPRPRLAFVVESGTDVRLVEGLAERFEVTVLARRIAGGVEVSRTPDASIPVEVGPASRLGFARLVLRRLRTGGFDAVLVQGYGAAALAANLAGRLGGAPAAMLVCSPVEAYYRCRRAAGDPAKPYRRREIWGLSALARLNARLGRGYAVLSEHLGEVVRGHGGRLPVAVAPVYGVDLRVFHPTPEPRSAVRARLGLPASGSLLFFSSRVAPEKDAATLLAAVAALRETGRDLWLLHRSGGHAEFAALAQAAGVGDRTIATDAVHPLGGLADDYRAADLVIQASRAEGLGFSVLEALACGTPVVAAAVGGLRETIVDGETGWCYPPGDAEGLARAIAEALDRPEEAKRRAEAGRAVVAGRYERGRAFDALEAFLRELAGGRWATDAAAAVEVGRHIGRPLHPDHPTPAADLGPGVDLADADSVVGADRRVRPGVGWPARVAVVGDFLEEDWPSMDLAAEQLAAELPAASEGRFAATLLRPALPRRVSLLLPGRRAFNADRGWGRYRHYPRWLARHGGGFDLWHVVDHSYAHLVHVLPAGRTVVTCHDLDAFRCLLDPAAEPRPAHFRRVIGRVLDGLRSAAHVTTPSAATREALLAAGLLPPERVTVVPNGVDPACRPEADPAGDRAAEGLLGPADPARPEILHVGAPIPRKRLDVVLATFAALRAEAPGARLVRIGGPLPPAERAQAAALGIAGAIVELPRLPRATLAAVYRRAAFLLQPSEREGFGLPVAEALACGTPVLASDLPVLREVAGGAAAYAPAGDPSAWGRAAGALLAERRDRPEAWAARRAAAAARGARFGWRAHAAMMATLYAEILGGGPDA